MLFVTLALDDMPYVSIGRGEPTGRQILYAFLSILFSLGLNVNRDACIAQR